MTQDCIKEFEQAALSMLAPIEDSFKKDDKGKPHFDLLPVGALEEVVHVLEHGAEKYGVNNWQKGTADRYQAALLRHFAAYQDGEILDKDSDLSHLAHLVCNGIFLLWFQRGGK